MTRCPECSSLLYRRVVGGVTLDGCPACGGVWMDKGELQSLAKDPEGLAMVNQAFPPGVQDAPSTSSAQPDAGAAVGSKPHGCPRCGEALAKFEYQTFRGIQLDRCKGCEGVWLDHGEASAIAARLTSSKASEGALASDVIAPSAKPSRSVAARFGALGTPAQAAAGAAAGARGPDRADRGQTSDPTRTAHLPLARGVAVGEFDREPGFFASFERGLRFIKGAYGLALVCPRLLLPLALGALLQLAFGAVSIAVAVVTHGRLVQDGGLFAKGSALLVALALLFGFAAQLFNTAVLAMTVSMVDAHLKGLRPDLGVAARDVVKNAGGVVAMAVVSAIVGALTSRGQRGRRGILASLVDHAWTVLSYLLLPIIMIEDVGLGAALRRAKEIHARGVLQIAVGEVGLRAIAGISAFVLVGLLVPAGVLLVPLGLTVTIAFASVAVLLLVSLGVLHAFARGAYYTCLFLWAVEVEREGDPAMARVPAPLAAALMP